MSKYSLEFIVCTQDDSLDAIKNSIVEFGERLEITGLADEAEKDKGFKINISTQDPTIIFDACAQFGRLKSIKIEEL